MTSSCQLLWAQRYEPAKPKHVTEAPLRNADHESGAQTVDSHLEISSLVPRWLHRVGKATSQTAKKRSKIIKEAEVANQNMNVIWTVNPIISRDAKRTCFGLSPPNDVILRRHPLKCFDIVYE